MKKICNATLPLLTTMALLLMFSSNSMASMENGVPLNTSLSGMTIANIGVMIPEDATSLRVSISNGNGDLDLYLKHGSEVSGRTLTEIDANADIRSDGPTANETILLTPSTSPALQAGIWYIATVNLNNENTTFTLTATFETVERLPSPASRINYPAYPPTVSAETAIDPARCKPIGVGSIAYQGDILTIEVDLNTPSGLYDAYLAWQYPTTPPGEYYMLGQDGVVYPYSTNGFVKWRQSTSGNIKAKPFGDLSAANLPAGKYNVFFLLANAGSLDTYYLWSTYFNIADTQLIVPDGSVDFVSGTLVVPNATIIYQGQEYEESASIPPDSLVSIIRDNSFYFYHTDLGRLEISDEMTRKAVGRFVMGPATKEARSATASLLAPNSENFLTRSSNKTLKTGVELERMGNDVVKVTNNQYRWTAVKFSDGSGPYFLPPVHRFLDNNLPRLLGTRISSKMNINLPIFDSSTSHEDIFYPNSDNLVIESYGPAYRPLSYLFEIVNSDFEAVYNYLTGRPSSIELKGMDLRYQKDAGLSAALDAIDLSYLLLEGLKHTAAAIDWTEGVEPVVNAVSNIAMALIHHWQAGDAGIPGSHASLMTFVEDLANDIPTVLINGATIAGMTPFFTLVDIIAALDYTIEAVHLHDIQDTWVYDEIRMEAENDSSICTPFTQSKTSWKNYTRSVGVTEWNWSGVTIYLHDDQTVTAPDYISEGNWYLNGNHIRMDTKLINNLGELSNTKSFTGTISSDCTTISGTVDRTSSSGNISHYEWKAIRLNYSP